MAAIKITELDPRRPIHLVGIAGSAMNGLATIFRRLGFAVRGTDPRADTVRDALAPLGIEVFSEQDGRHLLPDTGLAVITQAVSETHPEVRAARAAGVPVMTYPQCIGALMADRFGAAVAGTHGKTSVTAMTVSVLSALGLDPGFVVGGFVPELGAGAAAGSGGIFVAEACEFNRSFLELAPKAAVITNIEADHLDVYKDLAEIQEAFRAFARLVEEADGVLITAAGCPNIPPVIEGVRARLRTFGIEDEGPSDYTARNLKTTSDGTAFELVVHGKKVADATLSVYGRHNVLNALAAIALCDVLGVAPVDAIERLAPFKGAKRRFEVKGEIENIAVLDDYAHHPTAVRLLIQAARERFPERRIAIAFQPHQYSRTRLMLDDFADALSAADRVIIPNIYFARDKEEDVKALRPEALSEAVSALGTEAVYIGDLPRTADYLIESLTPGDILLLAGAGDVDTLAPTVLEGLERRFHS